MIFGQSGGLGGQDARPTVLGGRRSLRGWWRGHLARDRIWLMVFRSYRRRLPHWRDEDAMYFVTWRLHSAQTDLNPAERTLVLNAVTYFADERYELLAAVVMNDHVHVVFRPFEGFELERIVHSWKSFASNEVMRGRGSMGPLWQDEYFDRIIRHERELNEKLKYIEGNPLKRWPELEEYEWCWFPRG